MRFLIGIITAFPAAKALLQVTKQAIDYQLRQFRDDPFAEDEEAPMHEIAYYATKTVLFGWSTYNIASNKMNPIDVVVAGQATLEVAYDLYKVATRPA